MYSQIKKITDLDLKNKTVIVRTNFDVPLTEDEEVRENSRISASIKTIEYLLENECKVVLLSHLGAPEGKEVDELSLLPIRFELGRLLGKSVKFAHIDACENSIKFMEIGEILLLENLSFKAEEKSKKTNEQDEFMQVLIKQGDVFINDAFGVSENMASIRVLSKKMESAVGFSIINEIEKSQNKFESPLTLIIGGKPDADKFKLINLKIESSKTLLLSDEMAYVFMAANEILVGSIETESKFVKEAAKVIKKAKKLETEIVLPVDHLCQNEKGKEVQVDTQAIKDKSLTPKDLGEKTLVMYREIIEASRSIILYGTAGEFEDERFNKGTEAIGEYVALSTPKSAFKLVLGEDTPVALTELQIKKKRFNHISSSTPDFIKLIAKEEIPALELIK